MPRHLKRFDGVWTYYRRVPAAFAAVEPRRFVKLSLGKPPTRDRAEAERRAVVLERREWVPLVAHWQRLVEARAAADAAARAEAVAAEQRAWEDAQKIARAHRFHYRPAAELADEAVTGYAELRRRIETLERIGAMDENAAAALLGGRQRPTVTFRAAAEDYIAAHAAGWRNPKHRAQWSATLAAYAHPQMGETDVAEIDVGLVLNCLQPIWTAKAETAARVRMRIEAVLDFAAARGWREGANPARWKGHLDKLLPARRKVAPVRHHPALAFAELPAFMAALRQRGGLAARAVELCVLTAARSGEARAARAEEFDLERGIWTIPGERMKTGREHQVPLSAAALALVGPLVAGAGGGGDGLLFPGKARSGEDGAPRPLSDMALLQVLRDMGGLQEAGSEATGKQANDAWAGITVHGFRSSFRDWAAETTQHPDYVVEKALAHIVADKVEAAYRRGELFEKRRALMEEWGRFCGGPESGIGNREPGDVDQPDRG